MGGGHIILILAFFDLQRMRIIRLLGLQSGQNDPVAADHGFAGAEDHVAADGADMKARTEHVEGTVRVHDVRAGHQLDHGYLQRRGQRPEQGNVRIAAARFPFGHGLVADVQTFSQLKLRHAQAFPQPFDHGTGYVLIQFHHLLSERGYLFPDLFSTYAA